MRICDLDSGLGSLSQAFSELKERWGETKNTWNDEASRQFEQTHLHEIPPQMQLIVVAIQRLIDVLEKAERECADRPDE